MVGCIPEQETMIRVYTGWNQVLDFPSWEAVDRVFRLQHVEKMRDPNPRYDFAYVQHGGYIVARAREVIENAVQ